MTADSDSIAQMVKDLDKEADQIKEQGIRLAWHMRGGITYEQALQLSSKERTMISELVKENYETTKKSGLPHF